MSAIKYFEMMLSNIEEKNINSRILMMRLFFPTFFIATILYAGCHLTSNGEKEQL